MKVLTCLMEEGWMDHEGFMGPSGAGYRHGKHFFMYTNSLLTLLACMPTGRKAFSLSAILLWQKTILVFWPTWPWLFRPFNLLALARPTASAHSAGANDAVHK